MLTILTPTNVILLVTTQTTNMTPYLFFHVLDLLVLLLSRPGGEHEELLVAPVLEVGGGQDLVHRSPGLALDHSLVRKKKRGGRTATGIESTASSEG